MNYKYFGILPAILVSAPAVGQTVYYSEFEAPLGAEWTGQGSVLPPGTLPAASFGQGHLYNNTTTTGDAGASVLSLSSLSAHAGLDLAFDFMAWNSWDGGSGPFPSTDIFEVLLDGVLILSMSPANASGVAIIPPEATLTFGPAPYGFGDSSPFFDRDTVYRVSLTNLAHSSSTAAFAFRVNGIGWQGGSDEAFGLDNLRVSLASTGAIPEPATWVSMILGFGLLGAGLRRRRGDLATPNPA